MQEEEAAMEKFRSTAGASNPFAAAPAPSSEETPNILDLFGVAAPAGGSAAPAIAPASSTAATVSRALTLHCCHDYYLEVIDAWN